MMIKERYGFIYKTTLPDGRYYIGQHKIISQKTLDPKYLGSGVYLTSYIKSKGTIGIKREILEFASNFDELNLLEVKYLTDDILNDPLNINIDTGGRHIFSRTDDVCKRIGAAVSNSRKNNPENWPSKKGADNNKSINWHFISPKGEEFIFCGGLDEFCKNHGLSAVTMRRAVKQGWIPKRGICSGWQAFNLDNGQGTRRETINHGECRSGANNPASKAKIKRLENKLKI